MNVEVKEHGPERLYLHEVQATPFEGGFVVRRGLTRMFLEAEGLEPVLGELLERTSSDAGASEDELIEAVEEEDKPLMQSLVSALRERRMLTTEVDASGSAQEETFYWSYGATSRAVRASLAEVHVTVVGMNQVGLNLARQLRELGFGEVTFVDHPLLKSLSLDPSDEPHVDLEAWTSEGLKPDCLVVTSDFGGPDMAREWNAYCVDHHIHFLAALISEHRGLVGPLVIPGESACYECVALRERAAFDDIPLIRSGDQTALEARSTYGFVGPIPAAVASIAAMELLKFYSQALPGGSAGRIIDFDLLAPAMNTHRVLKLPRCPVCGPILAAPTFAADARPFMPGNE